MNILDFIKSKFFLISTITYLVITTLLIIILLNISNKYNSVGVYAPAEHLQGDSIGGLAGSLGGLAGLAGLNLNTSKRDSLQIALEIAKSKKFLFSLVDKHNLKRDIFAARDWDKDKNEIIYDEGIYNIEQNEWVRDKPIPEPTVFEVYKKLRKELSIVYDEKNTLVKISYTHVSPAFAKKLVTLIEVSLNNELKERNINDALATIELIKATANTTDYVDLKGLLYELMQEQTKKLLLAKSRQHFILEPIDPPIMAEDKSSPKRGLLLISFSIFYSFLVLLLALFRFKNEKV